MAVSKRKWLLAIPAGLLLILAGQFIDPASRWLPQCPLYQWTKLYCSGCGTGRGLHALVHGDIASAFRYNLLLIPLLLTIGLLCWKPNLALKPAIAWSIFTVVLLFGVLRNIPAFSFLAPH